MTVRQYGSDDVSELLSACYISVERQNVSTFCLSFSRRFGRVQCGFGEVRCEVFWVKPVQRRCTSNAPSPLPTTAMLTLPDTRVTVTGTSILSRPNTTRPLASLPSA